MNTPFMVTLDGEITYSVKTLSDLWKVVNEYNYYFSKREIRECKRFEEDMGEFALCWISVGEYQNILGRLTNVFIMNYKEIKITPLNES